MTESWEPSESEEQEIQRRLEEALAELREEFQQRLQAVRDEVEEIVRRRRAEAAAEAAAEEEAAVEEEVSAVPPPPSAAGIGDLLAAVAAIDRAGDQAEVLEALLTAAGERGSAALVLTSRDGARPWAGAGGEGGERVEHPLGGAEWSRIDFSALDGARALDAEERRALVGGEEEPPPAVIVPLVVGDRTAAALWVEGEAGGAPPELEPLQLLAYVAALALEALPLRERSATPTLARAGDGSAPALPLWDAAEAAARAAAVEAERAAPRDAGVEPSVAAAPEPEVPEPEAPEAEAVDEERAIGLETLAEVEGEAEPDTDEPETPEPETDEELDLEGVELEVESDEPTAYGLELEDEELPPPGVEPSGTEPAEEVDLAVEPEESGEETYVPRAWVEELPEAEVIEAGEPPAESVAPPVAEAEPSAEPAEGPAEPASAAGEEAVEESPEAPDEETPAEESEAAPPVAPAAGDETATAGDLGRPTSFQVEAPGNLEGPGSAFAGRRRPGAGREASDEARRLARLLVSEIKLYNEEAVARGRREKSILRLLGGEIDRSREVYEERVPEELRREHDHFRDELVRVLAGGDPELLGERGTASDPD